MSPPTQIGSDPWSQLGGFFADVNGDGLTDYIGWNEILIFVSLGAPGPAMGEPSLWCSGAFYGNVGNFVGDVDGDGKADLIAWNTSSVYVRRSTGTSFGSVETWSVGVPFYGGLGFAADDDCQYNFVEDVNGDGMADSVAWDNASIYALISDQSFYSLPQQIGNGSFSGQGMWSDLFSSTQNFAGAVVDTPLAIDYGSASWQTWNSGYSPQIQAVTLDPPWVAPNGMIALDVNGDRYKDFVSINGLVTNGNSSTQEITVELNDTMGGFGAPITYTNTVGPNGGWGQLGGGVYAGGTTAN